MQNTSSKFAPIAACVAASLAFVLSGCQSSSPSSSSSSTPSSAPPIAAPAPTASTATSPGNLAVPVHILAGYDTGITNNGVVWLPAGNFFADGQTIARPDITIATSSSTGPAAIYQAERYSMTKFTYGPIPNGDYTVKLHFCETYEGITGAGQRTFGYSVVGDGPAVKDFDIFATAGAMKPVVKSVPVTVSNHTIEVDFTAQTENPQINAIEILPGH